MGGISKQFLFLTLFAASMILGTLTAVSAEITVMGYRGPFEFSYIQSVIEPFMKAHADIQVKYHGVQNAAAVLGNIRAERNAPQVNAVIYDLSVAKIAKEEDLVVNLDTNKIPNYADLSETGKNLGGSAIPLTYDTLALIYDRNAYPTPPASWEALWDEKQDGKVVIPAQGGGDIQAILLTIIANRLAGETNYKRTIKPGVAKLIEVAPRVQTWEPKPDAYALLANGTATISIGYNARSQYYFDQTDGRVQSIAPVEGTVSQINVISAVARAPEMEATQTFINYAVSPEAQAAFAKAMFYAPTNTKTPVDEATRKRIPLMDPTQREKLIDVDWMSIGDMRASILQPWRRQIIPAGR